MSTWLGLMFHGIGLLQEEEQEHNASHDLILPEFVRLSWDYTQMDSNTINHDTNMIGKSSTVRPRHIQRLLEMI